MRIEPKILSKKIKFSLIKTRSVSRYVRTIIEWGPKPTKASNPGNVDVLEADTYFRKGVYVHDDMHVWCLQKQLHNSKYYLQ